MQQTQDWLRCVHYHILVLPLVNGVYVLVSLAASLRPPCWFVAHPDSIGISGMYLKFSHVSSECAYSIDQRFLQGEVRYSKTSHQNFTYGFVETGIQRSLHPNSPGFCVCSFGCVLQKTPYTLGG